MALTKLVESYRKKMHPENYKLFERSCQESVDLTAKNTKNRACRDLAEMQILQLADRYIKRKTGLE
jgi:predicted dienelactone hydrolase